MGRHRLFAMAAGCVAVASLLRGFRVDKAGHLLSTDVSGCRFELLQWTSNIVSAYLNRNEIDLRQIPHVMETVFAKLSALAATAGGTPKHFHLSEPMLDPVAVEKSITPDYIICLEDGVRLKTLKRYLFRKYRLTPEQYRNKWCLPADYPDRKSTRLNSSHPSISYA